MNSRTSARLTTVATHGAWCLAVIAAFVLGSFGSQSEALTDQRPVIVSPTSQPTSLLPGGPTTEATDDAETSAMSQAPLAALSGNQIERLASEALTDPNPLKRSLAMSKLLESLSAENALTVMAAMKTHRVDRDQWQLFRYAWAAVDADGAMAHALGLEGRERREAVGQTLSGWASESPQEALAWMNGLDDEKERQRYQGRFIDGLADHNISQATDYVFQLAEGGDKQAGRYLESVTREQLRKGTLTEATTWSEALPDGKLKGQAMDSVASRFVSEDPEAASKWAERFAGEDYAARVIEEVGDEWAERDPAASVAWLQSLPEGRGQSEGMVSALNEWTKRDPVAASEYLVSMPESRTKDSAVSGFARRLVSEDPEAAMAWASTIGQEEVRLETITNAAKEWYRRDSEAAAVWLESSPLPVEVQEGIRRGKRRG